MDMVALERRASIFAFLTDLASRRVATMLEYMNRSPNPSGLCFSIFELTDDCLGEIEPRITPVRSVPSPKLGGEAKHPSTNSKDDSKTIALALSVAAWKVRSISRSELEQTVFCRTNAFASTSTRWQGKT